MLLKTLSGSGILISSTLNIINETRGRSRLHHGVQSTHILFQQKICLFVISTDHIFVWLYRISTKGNFRRKVCRVKLGAGDT